jgi:ParB-like chromosome segregation protein Spo0J
MKTVGAAFDFNAVTLPLRALRPIRQVKSEDSAFGKYRAILASIRQVGVIEPLIVYPEKGVSDSYSLLDGHVRVKALQELKRTEAVCLIAKDNDVLTYNTKVSRFSVIQEHAMIRRALDRGVTTEQIAQALAIDLSHMRGKATLLDGIHPEVVELLKDRPIPAAALRLFRRVKPLRQIDMAQLMRSSDNYTCAYA